MKWWSDKYGSRSQAYIVELDQHLETYINTPGMLWDQFMTLRDNRKNIT
jgi:hypothetical protein